MTLNNAPGRLGGSRAKQDKDAESNVPKGRVKRISMVTVHIGCTLLAYPVVRSNFTLLDLDDPGAASVTASLILVSSIGCFESLR